MSAHNNISSQSCQGYRWIPVNSITISVPFCSRETFCSKAVQHSFSLLQLLCLTSAAKRRGVWQWSEMQAENTDMFQHAINSSWVPCHAMQLEGNPHLSICLHQGSVSSQVWYHPDMPSSWTTWRWIDSDRGRDPFWQRLSKASSASTVFPNLPIQQEKSEKQKHDCEKDVIFWCHHSYSCCSVIEIMPTISCLYSVSKNTVPCIFINEKSVANLSWSTWYSFPQIPMHQHNQHKKHRHKKHDQYNQYEY